MKHIQCLLFKIIFKKVKKTLLIVLLLLVLIFLFLLQSVNIINAFDNNIDIHINEIMSNPLGGDNNKEFIEIKGTKDINLSSFVIGDIASNDTLSLLRYCDECNYSLIVEKDFDYTNLNCSIYSAGSTIGNGLSNTADSVYLYFNNSLISNVSYQNIDEGYSYSLINNSWQNSLHINGSPCLDNANLNSQIIINNTNATNTNTTNSSTTINSSINITINISINITQNNSINLTNNITNITLGNISQNISQNVSVDVCNVSLELDINKSKIFFYAGEKIKFKNKLFIFGDQKNYEYIITYWVEDYFGNILKDKVNTTNENQKQWTANAEDNYLVARIKNKIGFINCTNINNNINDEFQIIIINNKTADIENREESSVEFEKIELSGKHLYVVGEVYKGNTGKTLFSIRFECEKENKKQANSQYFKLYFDKKFSTNKFAFRLPLIDVLDDCYSDATLTYSGLDLEGERDVDKFEYASADETKDNEDDINEELISSSNINASTFENNPPADSSFNSDIFIYPKTQDKINVSSYFLGITKETYFDALIGISNHNDNATYDKILDDKLTSNVAKEDELNIKYKPLSFLNFAIIILFILILLALVLKKW